MSGGAPIDGVSTTTKAPAVTSFFTPVSGAHTDGPLCYFLELGKNPEEPETGFNILLDCGWTDELQEADLVGMTEFLEGRTIDLVLLSGCSVGCIGAIPYLVQHHNLSCPILATRPVCSMGWITVYDVHNYLTERTGTAPFTPDAIEQSMKLTKTLRFDEKYTLRAKGGVSADDSGDVFISPHTAGTVLGGCMWHIVRDSYEICYAPQLNHKSDRHVTGADLQVLQKANLCILGADLLSRPAPPEDRDTTIIDTIMATLRRDGDVLIPVDATGRVLEILILLEEHWSHLYGDGTAAPYSVVFYSEYSLCTAKIAEQSLEWSNESLRRRFEVETMNLMSFASRGTIKFCKTEEELEDIKGAKVVLATPASCDTGYSLDLLLNYCTNPRNTIVVVDKNAANSVVRDLAGYAGLDPNSDEFLDKGSLFAKVYRRVELTDAEVEEWRQGEQKRLDFEAEQADLIRRSRGVKEVTDDVGSQSSDDADDDEASETAEKSAPRTLGKKVDPNSEEVRKKILENIKTVDTREGLFLPPTVAYVSKFLMFPCIDAKQLDTDEYGESLEPELLATLKNIRDQATHIPEDAKPVTEPTDAFKQWEEEEAARPKTVDELDLPKKYVAQQVSADVRAKVVYVPYEGLTDANTIRHVLKANCASAQQIIAIHGSEEDTTAMVDYCGKECSAPVFAPRVGETVDVTPKMVTLKVAVNDAMYSALDFVQVRDYRLASVEGALGKADEQVEEEGGPRKRRCGNDRAAIPVLSFSGKKQTEGHPATFVGDVKMRELSRQLRSEGFQQEMRKSSFLFNKECVIRRGDKGQMALNGTFTADWFNIRSQLRRNYTIL